MTCDSCGKDFYKRPAEVKRTKKNFCSKRCFGLERANRNRQRFFSKAAKQTNGCWLWIHSKNNSGYGTVRFMGRSTTAHRVAYLLTHGPVPRGLQIRHVCDTPACVNPAHLLVGTHQDNMDDMAARGRRYYKVKPLPAPPSPAREKEKAE